MEPMSKLSEDYHAYVERTGGDPHCNACVHPECESVGMGDDACAGFTMTLPSKDNVLTFKHFREVLVNSGRFPEPDYHVIDELWKELTGSE